jgi:protein-tyrosine phosphatase
MTKRAATAGAATVRDLGGLPTQDGRRVRPGRLYRSGALQPDVAERAVLRALGLRLICDLRSATERSAHPCLEDLEPAPRRMHLELSGVLDCGTAPLMQQLRHAPSAQTAEALMLRTYELLPAACAPQLGALFAALCGGEVPALIHCTAGKDRTGFVVAMLLSALDVPREAVLADYLLAARQEYQAPALARTAHLMQLLLGEPLESAAVLALSTVRAQYLETSFAAIAREFGGVDAYLGRAAGLDSEARRRLQAVLLAPAAPAA